MAEPKKEEKKEKKKVGRPRIHIDEVKFEELCSLQCTQAEICEEFNVTDKTLTSWCKRTYGKSFSEVFSQKRKKGFKSLRQTQFSLAQSGNATMLIWLGRNWLGQTDKPVSEDPPEQKIELSETESYKAAYNAVLDNLNQQLEKKKAVFPIYSDLVSDYMSYWEIKEKLKNDVKERGVYIKYNNGGGQTGETDNPSIDKLLKVTTKMKEILAQLEIDVASVVEEDDEL